MKVRQYQSDEERNLLAALITNDRVLSKVAGQANGRELFASKWANVIAGWCFRHQAKYQKAPGAAIKSLFRHYASKSQDSDTVELMEKFLVGLSEDFSGREVNEDFAVDQAARYFNQVQAGRERDAIEEALERGDVEGALERFRSFSPFTFGSSDIVPVFSDDDALWDAMAVNEEPPLVQYGGALGQFFGPHLHRDCFIAFLAPDKRGKSFWLIDVAWRASILNRRKTLFYSVGDMSQRQMMRRLIVRAARRPMEAGEVSWPRKIEIPSHDKVVVGYDSKMFREPLTFNEARKAMKKVRLKTSHSSSLLRLRCTPNSTTRVADIESDLMELARDGWVPEVVVIDYADILAAEDTKQDFRHQEDAKWRAMRRLSQRFHCLVVTATQSNSEGYSKDVLSRSNFSEDKRKLAHVTGMVGINQKDPEEKDKGIFRLNWIVLREGHFTQTKCVTVAGSLALSSPAMVSAW